MTSKPRSLLPRYAALLVIAVAVTGCTSKKRASEPQGIGQRRVEGAGRNLQATADGKTLAFVNDVAPPAEAGAPEGILQGVLTVLLEGGSARALGGGVTTLDDGYRLSPDGRFIAWLQGFRFREQAGTLRFAPLAGGEAVDAAPDAKFYKFSPDSKRLGFVAGGAMHLIDLATGESQRVTAPAATFEFSADGGRLLVRRPVADGGELVLVTVGSKEAPRRLGGFVGEYEFSPDGKALAFTTRAGPGDPYRLSVGPVDGALTTLGEGVTTFLFAPDGAFVAFLDGQGVKKTYGDLKTVAVAGGAPARRLGDNVQEYRWAPNSRAIAFRENHEDKGRRWMTMKVASLPEGTLRHKEDWTPNDRIDRIPLLWSGDGAHLAWLKPVAKPAFSIDLMVLDVAGQGAPRELGKWVFGYQFPAGGKELWYLTNCIRNGRQCDLMAASLEDPTRPAKKLVPGVWTFKASADGQRILLAWPRVDTESAGDLGWFDARTRGETRGIDRYVLPGALFLDKEGTRVAYLVGDRKRAGLYTAELK